MDLDKEPALITRRDIPLAALAGGHVFQGTRGETVAFAEEFKESLSIDTSLPLLVTLHGLIIEAAAATRASSVWASLGTATAPRHVGERSREYDDEGIL